MKSLVRMRLTGMCAATMMAVCGVHAMQLLDGIAAVVGEDPILASELEAYSLMRLNEMKMRADSGDFPRLRKQFLDEIIEGKVLLEFARKDTTISVSPDEIESALNEHISRLMKSNGMTPEDLERELRGQGMTLNKFRTQLRRNIQDQLLRRNVNQRYMGDVVVSRPEVESFFKSYADSLPTLGESFRLRKLVVAVPTPDSVREAAYARIRKVKTRLDNGEQFEELAKLFSDDPSGANGGDLGFVAKGTLTEVAFEEAAFALQPNQVSDVVETRFGFHVLKAMARKDQRVHIKMILVKVAPPAAVEQQVAARLDSIRAASTTEAAFVEAVRQFSTDARSRSREGDAGWFASLQIPEAYKAGFDSFAVGAVSRPLREDDGMSLLMVCERVADRKVSIETDYDLLAEKAKDVLAQKKLAELVRKWRQQLYIDIRIE